MFATDPETAHDAATTYLHADQEIFDTGGLHDPSSTDELTAPVAGVYVVSATVEWEANATGYRVISVFGSGLPIATVGGPALPSPALTTQSVTGIDRLAKGEVVRVEGHQHSGGDLDAQLKRFAMVLVAK